MVKTPVLFLFLLSFAVTSRNERPNHILPNDKDFCPAAVNLQKKARPNETAVQDCCDAFLLGGRTGVYWYRSVGRTHRVFCDMTNAGGGWLVILRRLREWPVQADSNSHYFERYYHPDDQQGDYQRGFGSLDQNFWLGLNKLYKLTNRSNVYAQARFEFTEDKTGTEYWVEYDTFAVGPKTSNYSLTIGNYTGGNLPDIFSVLNGSTFKPGNISCHHNSSWWYPKFDPHKYRPCRCLIPFVTSESSAVSRFKDACLGPPFDHLRPLLPPSHYEILVKTMEIKIRFKRYPCPHRGH